jgi:hypothetical protein
MEHERHETIARLYLDAASYVHDVRRHCRTSDGNWHPGALAFIMDELRDRCSEMVTGKVFAYMCVQHLVALAHEFFEAYPDPKACHEIGETIRKTFQRIVRRNEVQRMARERPELYGILETTGRRLVDNMKELLRPSA